MSIYLDCNASTPLEPSVAEVMKRYLESEFGNPGSRTHEYGSAAKVGVERARSQVASVVNADKSDVIFTSGATEANNLALLGLKQYLLEEGKSVITSQIEHKSVLEPLAYLESVGVKVAYLEPNEDGVVDPRVLSGCLSDSVGLVSLMHVNNETGAIQLIDKYADLLEGLDVFFHVDAAQGYGKEIGALQHKRIDMISCSAHKVYGPKGVGALISRQRRYKRAPLKAITFGGGQERGLRPGTLPTHQIAGFGVAAELALKNADSRRLKCAKIKDAALSAFDKLKPIYLGSENAISSTLNVSFPGINSEAAIVALKGLVAISNGSACTSSSYAHSHVLQSMRVDGSVIEGALRFSWCHMTEDVDWGAITSVLRGLS